jgi:hypothetical protein
MDSQQKGFIGGNNHQQAEVEGAIVSQKLNLVHPLFRFLRVAVPSWALVKN